MAYTIRNDGTEFHVPQNIVLQIHTRGNFLQYDPIARKLEYGAFCYIHYILPSLQRIFSTETYLCSLNNCLFYPPLFFNLYPAVRDITFQPAGCQGPYEYDLLCGLGYIDEPSHPVYTFTEAADVYITLPVKFSK